MAPASRAAARSRELIDDLVARAGRAAGAVRALERGRMADADAGARLGRARHDRPPRRHRRDRDRHDRRRPAVAQPVRHPARVVEGRHAVGRAARPAAFGRRGARVVGTHVGVRARTAARPRDDAASRGDSAWAGPRSSPRGSWRRGPTASTCTPRSACPRSTPIGSRHVAFLATRALPYAFSFAGRPVPAAPLRVELDLPSGAQWTHGPADAPDRITGPAGEYCRVFVQRLPAAERVRPGRDGCRRAKSARRRARVPVIARRMPSGGDPMPLFAFEGLTPRVDPTAFVAPTATLVGDVIVEAGASIWYGAVIRADYAPVIVRTRRQRAGRRGAARAARASPPTSGAGATVAHNCVVHGAILGDECLVANGSVVLDAARIGAARAHRRGLGRRGQHRDPGRDARGRLARGREAPDRRLGRGVLGRRQPERLRRARRPPPPRPHPPRLTPRRTATRATSCRRDRSNAAAEGVTRTAAPPSTTTTSPVIHDDASETRKSAADAMSSGMPRRPSGCIAGHRLLVRLPQRARPYRSSPTRARPR